MGSENTMTNIEILSNAIDKAIANGYSPPLYPWPDRVPVENEKLMVCWENVVYSHDFAKAFFGDKFMHHHAYVEEGEYKGSKTFQLSQEQVYQQAWRYHLQQMVLEKEPLKYLEKFL